MVPTLERPASFTTGISYASALVFFAFLCTGEVRWPTGQADAATAMEVLILANTYGVAFLLCDMEVALQLLSLAPAVSCYPWLISMMLLSCVLIACISSGLGAATL
jgi:hypothetical protein